MAKQDCQRSCIIPLPYAALFLVKRIGCVTILWLTRAYSYSAGKATSWHSASDSIQAPESLGVWLLKHHMDLCAVEGQVQLS